MNSTVLFLAVAIGFAAFFVVEGLILGKLFQPALVYVAYVTIGRPPVIQVAVVTVAAALGATTGQWLLYRTFTPTKPPPPGISYWSAAWLERLPGFLRRRLGQRWVVLVERQIDRFGAYGVAVCTAIPWIRMAVPFIAGVGAQPERRYTVAAALGNTAYMLLLLGVAYTVLGFG